MCPPIDTYVTHLADSQISCKSMISFNLILFNFVLYYCSVLYAFRIITRCSADGCLVALGPVVVTSSRWSCCWLSNWLVRIEGKYVRFLRREVQWNVSNLKDSGIMNNTVQVLNSTYIFAFYYVKTAISCSVIFSIAHFIRYYHNISFSLSIHLFLPWRFFN